MEGSYDYYMTFSAHFGSTYTKTGMMQRRSAWSLCRNDTQLHEAFCIFSMKKETLTQVHLKYSVRVPYRSTPRRNTSRHILIKLTKVKYKNIKINK